MDESPDPKNNSSIERELEIAHDTQKVNTPARESGPTSTVNIHQVGAEIAPPVGLLDQVPLVDLNEPESPKSLLIKHISLKRILGVLFIVIGFIVGSGLALHGYNIQRQAALNTSATNASARLKQQTTSLSSLDEQIGVNTAQSQGTLTVNGQLVINNSIDLRPSAKPNKPASGELYYDQNTNQLEYYDGIGFVTLQGGGNITDITNVTNVNGGSGGLSVNNATIGSFAVFSGNNSIRGTQISSANLTDNTNLAKLSSPQTFTGSNTFADSTNSTIAFQIQDSSGSNVLAADTVNNAIVLGSDGASPSIPTIRGGAAVGSNVIGSDLTIEAPNGTGVGGSGDIVFDTGAGVVNPLVTVDATSGVEEGDSSTTLTWSHTTGSESDRVLIVAVNTTRLLPNSPATAISVSYNGVALTELTSLTSSEANGSVWYLANPPNGAHTVSVSLSGGPGDVGAEATTFYNVDQTTPIATYTTGQVFNNNISTTLAGTDAGEGVFDALMTYAAIGNPVPGAGQTREYLQDNYGDTNTGSFKQGEAGSTTMSWGAIGSAALNQVIIAFNPEPNVTPDPLTEALRITQSGTIGVDLVSGENALNTITFGGGADRTIGINQNPGTGGGHNLTLRAGTGAVGSNNGGNLILQAGAATGSGNDGSVLIEPQTDSTEVFEILQQSSDSALFTADTENMIITIAGTDSSFATLLLNDSHLVSTQTTPPTVGTPINCGTNPTAAVTAGSTDSAGSFTIHTGTGSPTTCDTTITFNKTYGTAPKSVILTPTKSVGGATTVLDAIEAADSTTSLTIQIAPNNAAGSTAYSFNYWIIE